MITRRTTLCAAVSALLLAACATPAIRRGPEPGATADQVRAEMGAPDRIWEDPDGGQSWEYARPTQTDMARFDPKGALIRVEQVVTRENARRVRYGMTREEVERILGRPQEAGREPRTNRQQWTWHYRGSYHEPLRFDVYLNDLGYVTGTSSVEEGSP